MSHINKIIYNESEPSENREDIWISNNTIKVLNDKDIYETLLPNRVEKGWTCLNEIAGLYYRRVGDLVELILNKTDTSTTYSLNGWAQTWIGSLPIGDEPIVGDCGVPVMLINTGNGMPDWIRMFIRTDGEVYLFCWGGAQTAKNMFAHMIFTAKG